MDFANRLRKWLRYCSPLFAVMLFLIMINLATSPNTFWAIFPIGGMMIPVLIMAANIFLSDSTPEEVTERRRARALRREEQHAERRDEPARVNLSRENASKVAQAQNYKRQIDALINSTPDPSRKDKLRELSVDVDGWIKNIEEMSVRVDAFKRNSVIQNDLQTVPESIKKLTTQLSSETDPRVKETLERTLAARADQMKSLQKLQGLMRGADVQLENTLAALGTIYSQALAMQSTSSVADYAHLTSEVDEQSKRLRDQLEALEEIKLGREKSNLG
jgi:hypothetical protein